MNDDNDVPNPAAPHGRQADGTPITDAMIEAMADEAEGGFDVGEILARRRTGPDAGTLHGARGHVLAHPTLTSAQADDVLGSPGASFQAAFAGTLISLDDRGIMRVPESQLDVGRGRVRSIVSEINALLGAGANPWGCASWWFTPSAALPEGLSPADAAVAGGHDDLIRRMANAVATAWEPTVLPLLGITLDEARERLTALHFAREALTGPEQKLLSIAWGLLRLLDVRLAGGGTAR